MQPMESRTPHCAVNQLVPLGVIPPPRHPILLRDTAEFLNGFRHISILISANPWKATPQANVRTSAIRDVQYLQKVGNALGLEFLPPPPC
jgi:hypothetical protein